MRFLAFLTFCIPLHCFRDRAVDKSVRAFSVRFGVCLDFFALFSCHSDFNTNKFIHIVFLCAFLRICFFWHSKLPSFFYLHYTPHQNLSVDT
nr:MAG TPA: hypothetical protein [Caudoviricetes sp.]